MHAQEILAAKNRHAAQQHRTRLGRLATARGTDKKIDYARSYTAAVFVTYFAQRLSLACVMYQFTPNWDWHPIKTPRAAPLRAKCSPAGPVRVRASVREVPIGAVKLGAPLISLEQPGA